MPELFLRYDNGAPDSTPPASRPAKTVSTPPARDDVCPAPRPAATWRRPPRGETAAPLANWLGLGNGSRGLDGRLWPIAGAESRDGPRGRPRRSDNPGRHGERGDHGRRPRLFRRNNPVRRSAGALPDRGRVGRPRPYGEVSDPRPHRRPRPFQPDGLAGRPPRRSGPARAVPLRGARRRTPLESRTL